MARGGHTRNLLQGEGHVEGELRPLGVQHDGYLVGGLEDPVKGLALRPVVQQQGVGFQRRGIGQPQLLQEAVQGGLEVLLGDYGTGRERQQQGNGQEDGVSEKGTDAHTVKSLEVKADGGIQGESADITILNIKQLTDTTAYAVYHKSSPLTNINDTLRMIKEEGRWVVNQVIIIPSILDTTNHPQRRRVAPRKAKKLKRIPIDSVNVAKTKWAVDGPSTVQE